MINDTEFFFMYPWAICVVFFGKGAFILCILTFCHVCFVNLCYKEVPHPMAVLFIVKEKKSF